MTRRPAAAQVPDEHEHFSHRAPWLRAGVLGANDGLVSVASLMLGVGGGSDSLHLVVLAGVAGLVGGALSMAVGEYISVSSQRRAPRAAWHPHEIGSADDPTGLSNSREVGKSISVCTQRRAPRAVWHLHKIGPADDSTECRQQSRMRLDTWARRQVKRVVAGLPSARVRCKRRDGRTDVTLEHNSTGKK